MKLHLLAIAAISGIIPAVHSATSGGDRTLFLNQEESAKKVIVPLLIKQMILMYMVLLFLSDLLNLARIQQTQETNNSLLQWEYQELTKFNIVSIVDLYYDMRHMNILFNDLFAMYTSFN